MKKQLNIAKDFSLPLEAVTQTFAILAKRGVGKTYTASVMVEEMLKAGMRPVVIDPVGVWWGLRTSADKKSPGLEIIIAGGDHADVPIEPGSGEVIANFVIDNNLPLVIDLSHFRKNQAVQFMTDFAETLYFKNRAPLHLVIDEADAYAPQRPMKGTERLLGAIEDLVRRGRARGIGVTLITQRPAVLNKNVLTQIEVLVTLRLVAPQDRAAINEWIKVHGTPEQEKELMDSLPSLPVGTAWMWSAGWLDVFQKVQIRQRETYDSSSTPEVGEMTVAPKSMADVDLTAITKQLSAVIEKVQADDPKALRRKIAELERDLAKKPTVAAAMPAKVKQVEVQVPVMTDDQKKTLAEAAGTIREASKMIVDAFKTVTPLLKLQMPADFKIPNNISPSQPISLPAGEIENTDLSNYATGLLEVMAQYHPTQLSRSMISTLSGRKPRSSAFSKSLKDLQSKGYIQGDSSKYALTDFGMKVMSHAINQAPKTPEEVVNMWRGSLPAYERDLFEALLSVSSRSMTYEELSEATGKSLTSSGFHRAITSLVNNGLATKADKVVTLSEDLS